MAPKEPLSWQQFELFSAPQQILKIGETILPHNVHLWEYFHAISGGKFSKDKRRAVLHCPVSYHKPPLNLLLYVNNYILCKRGNFRVGSPQTDGEVCKQGDGDAVADVTANSSTSLSPFSRRRAFSYFQTFKVSRFLIPACTFK